MLEPMTMRRPVARVVKAFTLPRRDTPTLGFEVSVDYRIENLTDRPLKVKTEWAGPTVGGDVPGNWRHAADVGIDAILTDYPLEMRTTLGRPTRGTTGRRR